MLNHDTGQMNWDRFQVDPPNSYINHRNLHDPLTFRGIELASEAQSSINSFNGEPITGKGSWIVGLIVAAFILMIFLI